MAVNHLVSLDYYNVDRRPHITLGLELLPLLPASGLPGHVPGGVLHEGPRARGAVQLRGLPRMRHLPGDLRSWSHHLGLPARRIRRRLPAGVRGWR